MVFEKNVGGIDRAARAALSGLLTIVAVQTLRKGRRSIGIVSVVAATMLLFNVATQFCGLNAALGIDTCEDGD